MAVKTLEELKAELKEMCEKTNTRYSGIEHLIYYYMQSLCWTEFEAINYVIGLFKNGTIEQIKVIDKDGKVL